MPKTNTIKTCVMVVLLLIVSSTHGQEEANIDLIKSEFKKFPKIIQEDHNFKNAFRFFLEQEHDSTLLYSHNFLVSRSSKDEYSFYCHYFRGISFREKGLNIEAQKEFKLIPESFELYYSSKFKLGEIALELGRYSEALEFFLEIKELPEQDLRQFKKDVIYHNIGLCYLHLEKFDQSEEYLLESLRIQEMERDTETLVVSYMNIANLYYVQYKDEEAIPYFEKAYSLSKLTDDFTLKQNAALNMAAVEENRGDYMKSLEYRKEYEQWKDSINDQNKIWAVAQLEKKFITEQKQKEISLLEKDNKLKIAQRNSFIYSSVLLLLLVLTVFYFYQLKRKRNRLILAQKTALDELNDTKDRLFSVVSHDLRSNVNALAQNGTKLSATLESKKYVELDPLIRQNDALTGSIRGLLDNMLNWALLQTKQLYFQQEDLNLSAIVNQVTHNYKPLLMTKNIALETDIPGEVFVYADLESLKIVLRNVIDNAIKFSDSNDRISIRAKRQNKSQCELIIEDTGSGMSEATMHKLLREKKSGTNTISQERTGLGLHLCQAMIVKNGGTLTISSEENIGTQLNISLPLSQDYE